MKTLLFFPLLLASSEVFASPQEAIQTNYSLAIIYSLLIMGIVFLPGIWWNLYTQDSRKKLELALVPIPGILILALFGILFWILPDGIAGTLTIILYTILLLAAIDSGRRAFRLPLRKTLLRLEIFVYLAVVMQAFTIGVNPLPVAQEFGPKWSIPGRMVASPPDHLIPYYTADYIFHHYSGKEKVDTYFWGWSITSRGPLVALGVNTLFHTFRITPPDPPNLDVRTWPVSDTGTHLARIYGWITNALVILAAFHLLTVLGVETRRKNLALIWIALSPVVLIDAVFLWPKLLAAYFLLLSTADVLQKNYWRAGIFIALSWLSHPVGVIFIPCLISLMFYSHWLSALSYREKLFRFLHSGTIFVATLAVTMAAWLVYKAVLRQPDLFLTYLFGDGHGTAPAKSLASWALARWDNFWITLSPATFFYSSSYQSWLQGPLDQVLRWTVQYARTLPGHLGISCFLIAYLAIFSKQSVPTLRAIKYTMLILPFMLMVLVWGYSPTGLGGASLEPLSFLVLVFAGACTTISPTTFSTLMLILFLEGRWIEFSGFVDTPSFSIDQVGVSAWICWGLSSLIALGLAGASWRLRSSEESKLEPAAA